MNAIPEVFLDRAEADCVETLRNSFGDLASIEFICNGNAMHLVRVKPLRLLRERILSTWALRNHVVVRGVPVCNDGSTSLLVAMLVFPAMKSYRHGQIVKHFRMSPWTTALSHTTASGSFHTDINTADVPPAATIMQCLHPDPAAPAFGQLRVAVVGDVLAELASNGANEALRFLSKDSVTMLNETSPNGWSGAILADGGIRFHPESLRAAQKRYGTNPPDMESCLTVIHEAAMAVSTDINLVPGELLIVSNRHALHQRGACTVRFHKYPRDFESRKVAVLHSLDEPT